MSLAIILELARTGAHLATHAGRIIAEELGVIRDPWQWAIVHLMGQKRLYGHIRRTESYVEVLAFDPDNHDLPAQSFHGWGAVYNVEIRPESEVRRAYVESASAHTFRACAIWIPASVYPTLCRTCGCEQQYHEIRKRDEERIKQARDLIRGVVGDPTAIIVMRGEDGEAYDGTNGPIEYVVVGAKGSEGTDRQLTADEWEQARQAGVRLGPYGSQDPTGEYYGGSDDDIPFMTSS